MTAIINSHNKPQYFSINRGIYTLYSFKQAEVDYVQTINSSFKAILIKKSYEAFFDEKRLEEYNQNYFDLKKIIFKTIEEANSYAKVNVKG